MSASPKQIVSRLQARGVGWFLDWIGDVQVVYMDGRVTDSSYALYLDAVAREIDGRSEDDAVSVLYYVPQPSAVTADRRIRLGAVLKERERRIRGFTRAYAMATPSLVVRSGLKMVFWLAPPPYPNAVVSTPREGFEFIARHHPAVDPDAWVAPRVPTS
jgi:hypothetical protein